METIDVHSRSFAAKWIQIPDGATVMFQLKPIKRSITFGIYRSQQPQAETPYSVLDADSNNSSTTSLHRRRSNSQLSMEERLRNSSLVKVQSYGMLNGNEMFQGELKVEKGGIFAFIFDNTFSKNYSKKILFNKFFVEEITVPDPATNSTRKMSVSSSSLNLANQLHPNNGQYLQGYLLKRKRKKLQGFTKRYFVLNFKYNTLSYYMNEKSLKLRGEVQVNLATISAFKDENTIVIDSGMEIWTLKTLNKDDWNNWINALNFIKSSSQKTTLQPTSALANGAESPGVESTVSTPQQLPHSGSIQKSARIEETPEFGAVKTRDIDADVAFNKIDSKIDKLASLLSSLESKVDHTELSDARTEIESLSSYVKSLMSQSTPRDLVLSSQTSVLSDDDFFDALDDLAASNEEADDSLDNRVLVLPGEKGQENYSVDDLSDVSDDYIIETPTQAPIPDSSDLSPLPLDPIKRRNNVQPSTCTPPSLFSHLRKNVGKDMSTISMPVTANEPLTILQKMAEMFEHSYLLNEAAHEPNVEVKMIKIAMFAIANLGSFRSKERNLRKPFNPILGESYEFVDGKLGLRLLGEKICHKPQIFAFHCDSKDWEVSFTLNPEQKFWGKSVELINKGVVTLVLKETGEVYKWQQPSTLLKNIIAGDRYTEPVNSVTVTGSSGLKSLVEFKKPQGGLFSSPRSEELTMSVLDKSGKKMALFAEGNWTSEVYMKSTKDAGLKQRIYTASELLKDEGAKWGFTVFASNLNEITSIEKGHIPFTDSRMRPDVRAYESGDVKTAETLKLAIEQRQRERRKEVADAGLVHVPSFFEKRGQDDMSYEMIKGEKSYWEMRKQGNWAGLTELW